MLPKLLLLLLLSFITGCGAYTQAQVALVEQARRGSALWADRETQRRDELGKTFTQRRDAIDQAFDADVLARPQLDPAWVIEHRKAYALAVDAVERERQTAVAANEAALANARAVDAALARLLWLISLRSDLETFIANKGGQP